MPCLTPTCAQSGWADIHFCSALHLLFSLPFRKPFPDCAKRDLLCPPKPLPLSRCLLSGLPFLTWLASFHCKKRVFSHNTIVCAHKYNVCAHIFQFFLWFIRF